MFIQSPYIFNETVNKTREYLIDKVIVVKTTPAKACREYEMSFQPNRGETKALKYPQRNQKKKKKKKPTKMSMQLSILLLKKKQTNHGSSCLGLDVESFSFFTRNLAGGLIRNSLNVGSNTILI